MEPDARPRRGCDGHRRPTPDDARAKPPVQYSIPALELRRLIAEARAKNESFELEYAHLEGGSGTEHWRATSAVKTIVYRYDAAASRASCHALYQSAATGRRPSRGRCADDEIAMLPKPPWWALWLIAFQPLPILAGEAWAEVHLLWTVRCAAIGARRDDDRGATMGPQRDGVWISDSVL